jgi:hypothetical protein
VLLLLLLLMAALLCLQATSMMLAPLPNYAGQPLVPPAKDALQFVAQLHSDILAAVLPLWSHPTTCFAPTGVVTSLVRVLQTCAQGPSHASAVLRHTQRGAGAVAAAAAARAPPAPDAGMVQHIMEMGFSQGRAEDALRRVGVNSVELAMEWLLVHPEEPPAPAAAAGAAPGAAAGGAAAAGAGAGAAGGGGGGAGAASEADREEEELTRALLASLSVVGMSPDAVAQRSSRQQDPQQAGGASTQATDVTIASAEPGSPGVSTANTGTAAAGDGAATPVAGGSADLDDVTTPQAAPAPVVQPGAPLLRAVAPAAAAVGAAVGAEPGAGGAAAAAGEGGVDGRMTGIPAPAQLVEGAVHLVAASPSTAFSIADLLVTMAQCDDGRQRAALVTQLMDACLPPAPSSSSAAAGSSSAAAAAAAAAADFPPAGADVLTPARLLLLLLHKDPSSRKVAASSRLVQRSLVMLQNWQARYSAAVAAFEAAGSSANGAPPAAPAARDASSLQVPVWVEAVLLLLGLTVNTQLRQSSSSSSRAAAPAARGGTAPAAVAAAVARFRATGERPAPAGAAAPDAAAPAAAAAGGDDAAMADQPAAAAAAPGGAAGGAGDTAGAGAPAAAAPPSLCLPPELAQLSGLSAVLDSWRPCGLLDDGQQAAATSVCLTLLQQLHDHADEWDQPSISMFQDGGSVPNPSAVTQALLQLLEHLSKRYANAQQVLAAGGHKLLLSLPAACLAPSISRQEGSIGAILRHLLEDPVTLEGWMEAEIRNSMANRSLRDPYTGRAFYNQTNPHSKCVCGRGV